MSQAGWRKWHRWIGFAALPFVFFAVVTGIVAGLGEMLSEDEEVREANRARVSEIVLPTPNSSWSLPFEKSLAKAAERAPGAPLDRIALDFKNTPPLVTVYVGKKTGGEDKKLIFDATSGEFLREERYEDKSFLTRLHSGEAFGDWGLVFGTAWGVAMLVLIVSGTVIYFAMRKKGQKGWRRVFW